MYKIYLLTPLVLSLLFLPFTKLVAQVIPPDHDPDLPLFRNITDKEAYLKARNDFIDWRRGIPYPTINNPRLAAIAVKELQEQQQLNNPNNVQSAPAWISEGPAPIPNGQTTGASVPVSGRVTAIAIHPSNPNVVYVGTANGGIYRTANGGTTWTAIFDASQSLAIGALALAPSDPTKLYVGTGEANLSGDSYLGIGVYRIDNADVSPTLVGPINPGGVFTYRSVSKILVHPTDPATIFVSTTTGIAGIVASNPGVTPRGLFRSTNATAGAGSVAFTKLTVQTANGGNRSINDMVFEPSNPNTLYCTVYGFGVANDGGIYKTTNALAATPSFTNVLVTGAAGAAYRTMLAINKVGATVTIYAGRENGSSGAIIKSVDGGTTWITVTGTFGFCGGQCFYDIALDVDPADANKMYIGGSSGTNIFNYTLDGGATFLSSTVNLHADVHAVVVSPSASSTIYLGCDGGVFKSTNAGVTWASINTTGFSATQFQGMALHPTDTKFTIGGTQDNGTNMLKSDGTSQRIDFGDGGYALIDQNATNTTAVTMYHTYYNQTNNLLGLATVDLVANAVDNGWNFYGCGGTANGINCSDNVQFYAPIALGPGNPNTVYYASDRLYRSTNKAVTMTVVSQAPIVSGTSITTLSISKQDDNYRLLGLNNGTVWFTNTGSSTLTNITPAGAPTNVQRVYIDQLNKNIGYICYGNYGVTAGQHLWKSTNLNTATPTWVASGSGIPDVPVNAFASDPGNSNLLYAGTDIGVYSSSDGGATWSSYSLGLPVVPVFDMAVHPVNHNVRIATHGRGFWTVTPNVLPIELNGFTATARPNGKVYLEWFTASEQNNRGFDVERSVVLRGSAPQWIKVGFVPGFGTSSTPKRYYLEDEPVGGKRFIYRLKQIDYDGHFKYSDNREVTLRDFDYGLYAVYPNPARDMIVIKYKIPENNIVKISVFDNTGKLVREVLNESREAGVYQLTVPLKDLAAGVYYCKMQAGIFFNTKSFTVIK